MFNRVANQARTTSTREITFPPPSRGWIQSGNLLSAPMDGAEVLDNIFPTAEGGRLRGGCTKYADLGAPVRRLFTYHSGDAETLFGSTDAGIYNVDRLAADVTEPNSPQYIVDEAGNCIADESGAFIIAGFVETYSEFGGYAGTGAGDWSVTQMSTSGGDFLVGVNGVSNGFYYGGSVFQPLAGEAIYDLAFDAVTIPPLVGETATGATSGATATIHGVYMTSTTAGILRLGAITGTFQDNEQVTTATGAVTSNIPTGTSAGSAVAITGVAVSALSQVWNFKERLFFVEKGTLSAWYLPVKSIGGAATELPLGSVFSLGGAILFGATWSLDSGSGLDDVCIFVTTEGEIAVYEGTDPGSASTWGLRGVYRIGQPINKHAFFKAGGDLAILTKDGIVPVSEALQKDRAALQTVAITYPIEDAWREVVANASRDFPITPTLWHSQTMLIIGVPDPDGVDDIAFVANSRTGAWCRYTGWDVRCAAVSGDLLYFGSNNGLVLKAETGGQDNVERFIPVACSDLFQAGDYAAQFTGVWVPKFTSGGTNDLKFANHVGLTYLARNKQTFTVKGFKDYLVPDIAPPPPTVSTSGGATWGTGVWGTFVWGSDVPSQVRNDWKAISAGGYTLSAGVYITSNQESKVIFEPVAMRVRCEVGKSF